MDNEELFEGEGDEDDSRQVDASTIFEMDVFE